MSDCQRWSIFSIKGSGREESMLGAWLANIGQDILGGKMWSVNLHSLMQLRDAKRISWVTLELWQWNTDMLLTFSFGSGLCRWLCKLEGTVWRLMSNSYTPWKAAITSQTHWKKEQQEKKVLWPVKATTQGGIHVWRVNILIHGAPDDDCVKHIIEQHSAKMPACCREVDNSGCRK